MPDVPVVSYVPDGRGDGDEGVERLGCMQWGCGVCVILSNRVVVSKGCVISSGYIMFQQSM